MFQFFRYFVVIFLGLNLIPIAALLAWDQHHFKQMMTHRGQETLRFTKGSLTRLYKGYLHRENNTFIHIMQAFPKSTLSLQQYQTLMDSRQVWWVNNGKILQKGSTSAIPKEARDIAASLPEKAFTDFIVVDSGAHKPSKLATLSYYPLQPLGHQGILMMKSVPVSRLIPHGPFQYQLYEGKNIDPQHLIERVTDPFMRQMEHRRPHPGRPSPFRPGPPPRVVRSTGLILTNRLGLPVATIMIEEHRPPGPPFMEQSRWFGLMILLTSLVSSMVVGLYLRKNFVTPLLELSTATQKVHGGDLDARVETIHIKQPDVLATAENFNRMVEELSEKEALRKNFVTNLTHDLRTPLIAQERTLMLLAREFKELNLQEQASLAAGLAENNQHLLGMVNQLLETYKFEAGQLQLSFVPVSLPALTAQCLAQVETLAQDNNITFESRFSEDLPEITADSDSLKRVFLNLLGNAIENIPAGSTVTISGQVTEHQVEIHVRDNGPGISPSELEHIFRRYYVGKETQKIGSGLGLYICRMLIEAHQGSISVDSVQGQYTDFQIQLPLHPPTKE